VLWGKGGRGILVSCVCIAALAAPIAASAGNGHGKSKAGAPGPVVSSIPAPPPPSGDAANTPDGKTWIASDLLDAANTKPNDKVDVIITSSDGLDGAGKAYKWLAKAVGNKDEVNGDASTSLDLVGGIAVSISAKYLTKLQQVPGLIITPDALVTVSGLKTTLASSQLWPYESGNTLMWPGDQFLYAGKTPAVAIVDSGVQQRSDFGTRIVASVNLSTIAGNTSLDDQRGHGTFVAGIAAGAAPDLAGAAPGAPIVSIKVMDANGQAKTSDVINACQWILDHKDQYNIKVANFSLHSSYATNFYRDPLDRAVERLWFGGVTVVAAAGNYGTSASTPSGVTFSPGNDPFVITVGAVDLAGTEKAKDDTVAPWSAWGYTEDGFFKPDLSAPGRYMVGPVPAGSTLTTEKASNMVGSDRIQLSGTSFSAPVVSGTVADMLARHPSWSPDQVKGALMRTARALTAGNPKAAGLGELTASRAAIATVTPNPNLGLEQFVHPAWHSSGVTFDATGWASAARSNAAWDAMSWSSQSWSDMSWADQSWASMSWADMSWSSMSWTDMSWADMSWADSSQEDDAEGDAVSLNQITADAATVAAAATDPDTAVTVDGLDPVAALGLTAAAPVQAPATAPAPATTSSPLLP
jgi:serine protease AprX